MNWIKRIRSGLRTRIGRVTQGLFGWIGRRPWIPKRAKPVRFAEKTNLTFYMFGPLCISRSLTIRSLFARQSVTKGRLSGELALEYLKSEVSHNLKAHRTYSTPIAPEGALN